MTSADIEMRASEWLAREDAGLREEDRVALESWLVESSAHRVAYLRLRAAWGRADRLAALRAPVGDAIPALQESKADREPARTLGTRARVAAVVAGLAVAIAALVIQMDVGLGSGALARSEHQTPVGGREVIPLPDGSRLELNTDTRLHASVTSASRTVWLDQGEAYFEVVRDVNRPFVVIAGSRRVTVLGTKFSVRRDGNDVQVKVVEGRVQVDLLEAPAAKAPAVVTGGDVLLTRKDSALVANRSPEEIANELAWRHGVLVMNQWTLGDAAREFNRYNRQKLVVSDSVAGIRLGGSFESGNVDAFARLLHDGFGLHVEIGPDQIVVSD